MGGRMSSETAPRYETREAFIERIIQRLVREKHYPDRVVSKVVMPLLTGSISANRYKAAQLMGQVCETDQDRHSFRTHVFGGD